MISIIAAMDKNRLIGRDNGLPWRLSADLKKFKELTTGNAIIMGRKTWESLGRPLPNRQNIVISRQKGLNIEGCETATSLEEAISLAKSEKKFIIGGGQIYKIALEVADEMLLTEVDTKADGDAWFPEFNKESWTLTEETKHSSDEKNEHNFSFCTYSKKP